MPETSGFFDAMETQSGVYDRVYNASEFAQYFATFIGNGVFANPADQLKVVAKEGRTITLKAGKAFIDGYWYILSENVDFELSVNSSSYPITDLIAITLDRSTRTITAKKKEAVNSLLPINNGSIHELVVATVTVGVGVATITDSVITDRRPDETYCGFVKGTVEQIETADLFLQYQTAFNEWFSTIQGQLGDDVAGSLQSQINALPVIRIGTDEPDNGLGKDGDIYIKVL